MNSGKEHSITWFGHLINRNVILMRHETKNTEYHKTTENTGSTVYGSKQNAVSEMTKRDCGQDFKTIIWWRSKFCLIKRNTGHISQQTTCLQWNEYVYVGKLLNKIQIRHCAKLIFWWSVVLLPKVMMEFIEASQGCQRSYTHRVRKINLWTGSHPNLNGRTR